MSWSSRRNGIPRIGRTLPVPPLKDLTDQEYADMVDTERERDYEALHAPHDTRGFHLSPDGGEGHARRAESRHLAVAPYPASLGCCGASCKEDCVRPPCPCNLDCWTETEKREIANRHRKATAR